VKREDRELLELLGYLYLQYGKADEARTIYAALCEMSESRPLLTLTYAYCLAKAGQYAVALHHLELIEAESFSPKELGAYLLLRGNVLWHLGRDAEARVELQHFLECAQGGYIVRHSLITKAAEDGALLRAEQEETTQGEREILFAMQTPPLVRALRNLPRERAPAPYRVVKSKNVKNNEGVWKRLLRFIARKELENREHSR
jgi:tetratricopeptide (TPR) repeat protein